MRTLLVLSLLPLAVHAELLTVEVRFADSGCVSCTESLGDRLKRIRGVEQATVEAERSLVKLTLAPGNRARLSVIQGRIEQDGTRVIGASIEAQGVWKKSEGGLQFVIEGTGEAFSARSSGKEVRVGEIIRQKGRVTGFDGQAPLEFTLTPPDSASVK